MRNTMKAITLAALCAALSGCALGERVVDQLPTARYCNEVHYERVDNSVTLFAKCTAPFGGM